MRNFYWRVKIVWIVLLALAGPFTVLADNDGDLESHGRVVSIPQVGRVGTWVIGNTSFEATTTTSFEHEQHYSDPVIGTCVEVKYSTSGGVNIAIKIESTDSQRCSDSSSGDDGSNHDGSNPGSGSDDSNTGGPGSSTDDGSTDTQTHTYGILEQFPEMLIGDWQIGGITYAATAQTRFKREHGPFFIGRCVEAEYNTQNNVRTIKEVGTTEAYHCSSQSNPVNAPQPISKWYGLITLIPNGYVGQWEIGGMKFTSTDSKRIKQDDGRPIVNGACAEVQYVVQNGTNIINEIETTELYKCSRGTDSNKVYATIKNFPSGLYGTWTVQTSVYTPTYVEAITQTQFVKEKGNFISGGCVEINYHTVNGVDYADKIESKSADHCSTIGTGTIPTPSVSKLYAVVERFPDPYLDEWVIGGFKFLAVATTRFEQEHGLFDIGACVKATYTISNNVYTLLKVETKESAACNNQQGTSLFKSYGIVERYPTQLVGEWQVGGIRYQAITTTLFKQEHGFFSAGAFVEVKYRLENGARVAMSVETHVAPQQGRKVASGRFEGVSTENRVEIWKIGQHTYRSDPAMDTEWSDKSSRTIANLQAMPAVGQVLMVNYYEGSDGYNYVTYLSTAKQVFLPIVHR